jgi:hypothetical protein
MGREAGAGEAWNVAPAKAAEAAVFWAADWGGVVRPCLTGPGDVEDCFVRDLFPRGFDFALLGCVDGGAGLFDADFRGVYGLALEKSNGN